MGKIIPFSDWMILFPILIINFEPLELNEKHLMKEVFEGAARRAGPSCMLILCLSVCLCI